MTAPQERPGDLAAVEAFMLRRATQAGKLAVDPYRGYNPEGSRFSIDDLATWSGSVLKEAEALALQEGATLSGGHVAEMVYRSVAADMRDRRAKGQLSSTEIAEIRHFVTPHYIEHQLPWLSQKLTERAGLQKKSPRAAELAANAARLSDIAAGIDPSVVAAAGGVMEYPTRFWTARAILGIKPRSSLEIF